MAQYFGVCSRLLLWKILLYMVAFSFFILAVCAQIPSNERLEERIRIVERTAELNASRLRDHEGLDAHAVARERTQQLQKAVLQVEDSVNSIRNAAWSLAVSIFLLFIGQGISLYGAWVMRKSVR